MPPVRQYELAVFFICSLWPRESHRGGVRSTAERTVADLLVYGRLATPSDVLGSVCHFCVHG